jgi:hypothetical protein
LHYIKLLYNILNLRKRTIQSKSLHHQYMYNNVKSTASTHSHTTNLAVPNHLKQKSKRHKPHTRACMLHRFMLCKKVYSGHTTHRLTGRQAGKQAETDRQNISAVKDL